jgi:hypothetical protein
VKAGPDRRHRPTRVRYRARCYRAMQGRGGGSVYHAHPQSSISRGESTLSVFLRLEAESDGTVRIELLGIRF